MITQSLYYFLKEWQAWATKGGRGQQFRASWGLCSNACYRWHVPKVYGELKDALIVDFQNADAPFGYDYPSRAAALSWGVVFLPVIIAIAIPLLVMLIATIAVCMK